MKRISSIGLRLVVLALILGGVFAVRPTMARADAPEIPAVVRTPAANTGEGTTPEAQSAEKNEQEKDENAEYKQSPMVKALGAKLGMNAEQSATAFEVTNFILLAVFVLWLLAKMLPKMIRERNAAISKHLVEAASATADAKARLSSVEGRLAKLDEQIVGMRVQAEQDAVREEVRMRASVEEEKQKILAAAEQEIAAATTQAQKGLQKYAAELAIEQAARKLVVSAETDRLLVQSFAERLAGDDSKKGQN